MAKFNLNAIKRAPKWAWFTVAGVGVGAGALKLWGNRTTADGDTPLDENGSPTEIGTPSYGPGGGGTGIIVPPVIIPNDNSDQSGTGLMDLQALYMTGVATTIQQMTGGYEMVLGKSLEVTDKSMSVTDQVSALLSQSIGALSDKAAAGSAPRPATQYVSPSFAAAIERGDPNAVAYVNAGAPTISAEFAAQANAAGPDPGRGGTGNAFWDFIYANGGPR